MLQVSPRGIIRQRCTDSGSLPSLCPFCLYRHYVANSMESTKEPDGESFTRHTIDASIPMQDLVDSYMAPFQSCVEVGKVSSLMCSYNSVNGYPSCANHWLLQEVARDAWGFDGYITSDCRSQHYYFTCYSSQFGCASEN